MFILAEARAGSSGSEVLGLEQLGSQRLRRGPGQLGWQAVLGASSSRALESVFGLGLTAAELVLRPGVLQLQLPLLSLMNQIRDLVFPPLLACWLFTFLFAERLHGLLFRQRLGHPLLGPTELVITFDLHEVDFLPPRFLLPCSRLNASSSMKEASGVISWGEPGPGPVQDSSHHCNNPDNKHQQHWHRRMWRTDCSRSRPQA